MHETITSADGRYVICYRKDLTGFAQVVEYDGEAPRIEISRTAIPFSLLGMLTDKMLFSITNTAAITIEPNIQNTALVPVNA